MKSKLAASISPLSAAVWNRIRTSNSSTSMVALFGCHHSQIICRFKSSSRAAHSSVIEDDSFSELGPETSDCSAKQIRLVTEKPEYFLKPDPSRKGLAGRSNSSDNRPKSKVTVSAPFRASPTSCPKPGENSPVHPLDAVDVLAVRIKNISENTSDHDIHHMCKSLGELVGLARMSKDSVDAFFTTRSAEIQIHLDILKRLNSTVIDDCSWSADILRSNSSEEGGGCKLESQIYDQISGMRRQIVMDQINLEDLETLLFSILHIQEQAPLSDAN